MQNNFSKQLGKQLKLQVKKLLEGTKSTTKGIEELNESNLYVKALKILFVNIRNDMY